MSIAEFDMCYFGLKSAVTKTPMKKRTKVMTNSQCVFQSLHGKYCRGDHQHVAIQGSEGGKKRSAAAQEYPKDFCLAVCQALLAEQGAHH